jgi:beta-N-acetylhexosaminidase
VGLGGSELTGLERAWLRLVRPGGIILFKRNIVDATQTRTLLDEATGLGAVHSVRCVDVEGGTVNRLRDSFGVIPSAQAVAAATRRSNNTSGNNRRRSKFPESQNRDLPHPRSLAREHGELIARAVKAFGFNTALAPVVDLALPESATVMGSRTAGPTPAEAVDYARAFLAGLAAQNVAGCGKHFPGLGGGVTDSHFETPQITRKWQQLWDEDLVPYRELTDAMPMVMVNHAAYPETPGKNKPASASDYWITNVLRKRVGYGGIIVSDDLEMGGILKFLPVNDAAVAAMRAGTDMMLICHSAELILRTYEALITEAEGSAAFQKLLLTRAREVAKKRARLYGKTIPAPLSAKQFEALRQRATRFRESIESSEADAITPRAAFPAETS